MTETRRELRLAIETFAAREVPDSRTRVCDLSLEATDDSVRVTGTVSTEGLATRLQDRLRVFPAAIDSSIRVLDELGTQATVSAAAVPVRSDPDPDAEQVTKVLYGDEVEAYDVDGDWCRVTAPDGYLGWIAEDVIVTPEIGQTDAVLRSNVDGDAVADAPRAGSGPAFFPTGTPCQVLDTSAGTVRVQFRTGATASVPAAAVSRPDGLPADERIASIAHQFADTEYEWGGMTTDGIDCSGLVWVSYRVFGIDLPRDADQQSLIGRAVPRDDLCPGDLLFFPGHVAISLGGSRYIHAHGDSGGVVESSLDPDDEGYIEDLDEGLDYCRRLLPPERSISAASQ